MNPFTRIGSRFPSAALIKKELIGTLRSRVSFLVLCGSTGVVIFLVLASWPSGSVDLAAVARLSSALLFAVDAAMYLACILFIPGIAGASIVGERERGTLDMLRVTLIRPSGIVMAKMANAIGFFVLLIAAALPPTATMLFLVGIDWTELLGVFGHGVSSAIFAASIGIMCSVLFKKTYTAIVASYVGLFLFWIFESLLGLLAYALIAEIAWFSSKSASLILPGALPAIARFIEICICLLVAWKLLGRPSRHDAMETRKPIDDPAVLAARWKRFPYYLIDPLKRKNVIEDGRNPLFVREVRWGPRGRPTALIRLFYLALIIFIPFALVEIALSWSDYPYRGIGTTLLIHMVVIVMICPVDLASALTRERETGTLDMLRMTLLSPREIVLGKFFAGIVAVSPLVLASVLTAVVPAVVVLGSGLLAMVWLFHGYVTLAVCILIALSFGQLASSFAMRTGQAVVLSYGFAFLIFIGFFLALQTLSGLQIIRFSPEMQKIVAFSSPLVAFGDNFSESLHSFPITLYWAANTVVFALIGIGAIWSSVRRFTCCDMRER